MEVSPAHREGIGAAQDRGPRPPAAAAGVPGALLALQRTIGNARVVQALHLGTGVRRLQRTYEDDMRALLAQPLYAAQGSTATALQGLAPPGLNPRRFTRADTARWLEGTTVPDELDDPTVQALYALGQNPLLLAGFKNVGNRDALREMKALAAQVLLDLDALLQGGAGAGAAWTTKFNGIRTALVASKAKIDAMHYDAQLAARTADQKDAFRTTFAAAAETKLAELRTMALEVRLGGRLKFSQKRANARFSSAATVNNQATSALVAGKRVTEVATELTAGRIRPDQIPVQVFIRNGDLIAINNRGLSALSLAGFRPTNVIFEPAPSQEFLNRLGESDTFRGAGRIASPDFRIALTETDAPTDKTAVAVPVTV